MFPPIMQGSSVDSTLRGAYTASPTMYMLYGRGCVASLPTVIANLGASKAFIITGKSLREKTPVISRIEEILGETHHAGTYSGVREHACVFLFFLSCFFHCPSLALRHLPRSRNLTSLLFIYT
ncbi:alcohol dehydrogenase [Histoplasma capsulatum var. duboisii H88]|uniref:Alcohol dehydrogenase n=1 Tax=Ajellomyces capsulatus (strain H88) TaxID=544711 RepID=A0A8A1LU98_AJEC8|nr:alcohol dehydrogenase [Histoplasma capsulatum var. duboisii H88]